MRYFYFYPENPLAATQGNNARALALLQYFKSRGIQVVYCGEKSPHFQPKHIDALRDLGLIEQGFLLDHIDIKTRRWAYIFRQSIPQKIARLLTGNTLLNRVKWGQNRQVRDCLAQQSWDGILISYVYWAPLLDGFAIPSHTVTYIDTHDFITAQTPNHRKLGAYFAREIEVLRRFDKVINISPEESYIFKNFVQNQVCTVSHALPDHTDQSDQTPSIDLLYIASDNPHNRHSIQWFFDAVYPQLPKTLRITCIGKITAFIGDYPNVTKIPFAESLAPYYQAAKMAICPMLSGTGLKIKVVEALSYALPVVCHEKGMDGLFNKSNNGCLASDQPQRFAQHIQQLMEDGPFYENVRQQAREYFQTFHAQEAVYQHFDAIFLPKKA